MEIAAEMYIIVIGLVVLAIMFYIAYQFFPVFESGAVGGAPDKVAAKLAALAHECWAAHRAGLDRTSAVCSSTDIKSSTVVTEALFTSFLNCEQLPNNICDNVNCACTSSQYASQDKVRWLVESNETTIKISYDGNRQQVSVLDVKASGCFNSIMDGDEQGIDCGGRCAPCVAALSYCQAENARDGCASMPRVNTTACCNEHALCCSAPTTTTLPATATKKLLVLIYNPVLESKGGIRLNTYMNWNNADTLTQEIINDLKTSSGGNLNYQISLRLEVDDYPGKTDGFKFTDESYLACAESGGSNCHVLGPQDHDYLYEVQTYQFCERLNDGEVDEVWVWAPQWTGYYESRMAGPDAYWLNAPALSGTICNRRLPMMAFVAERGVAEALESYGHRTESIMSYLYGGLTGTWGTFAEQCGNAHNPPNYRFEYDRENLAYVDSLCDDWLTYPVLPNNHKQINCGSWGCSARGYLNWWYDHMPRAQGTTNGKYNNWWIYISDPNAV